MIERGFKYALLFVLAGAMLGGIAFSQTPAEDLKKEIEALKKGQEEIRKDLQELKQLIQARLAPRPTGPNVRDVVFELGDNPTKGENTAPLTLVEFTDYQ